MVCGVPYRSIPAAEAVRTPFLYPASACFTPSRLIVEVGPGRGDFLFHLAQTQADATIVGIEIKRKRVDRLISRIERRGLTNVCIVQDDARAALPRLFGEGTVDEIHIPFPDPWPKKRHGKNRTLTPMFLRDCRQALRIGGTISIVTDAAPYAQEIAAHLATTSGLAPCPDEAPFPDDAFPSLFALKWQSEGRPLFSHRARRVS